jgi:DNA-binding MarR family transcriptional regulator
MYLLATSKYVTLKTMERDLDALEHAMAQLHRTWSRTRRWESITLQAGVNLDRTSAVVLQVLARTRTKNYKLHEVAEILGVEAPIITRKVQLLEDSSLLTKQADKKDGRAFTLHITMRGTLIADRLRLAKRQHLKAIVHDWQPKERQEFVRLLKKFAEDTTLDSDS